MLYKQNIGRQLMYVCICKGITDSQIRDAVTQGASTLRHVRQTLGATSQCGKCARLTKDIIDETLAGIQGDPSLYYAVA